MQTLEAIAALSMGKRKNVSRTSFELRTLFIVFITIACFYALFVGNQLQNLTITKRKHK